MTIQRAKRENGIKKYLFELDGMEQNRFLLVVSISIFVRFVLELRTSICEST